uniref:DNA-(apurinic or apyrimidinic site) endonuclease 2 n=1 Tax=Xenopus tropicalis TaxID=8364 RepID=A0A6I8SN80_XENTR
MYNIRSNKTTVDGPRAPLEYFPVSQSNPGCIITSQLFLFISATAGSMKIVSWNINGIRATRVGLKETLDSLDADIICLQETKVTRVATFCKSSTTPWAAEEGLSGMLCNHTGSIGCYGNTEEFLEEELQSLDQEGRAVLTQHRIRNCEGKEETLTVINVYCPRADPEKPERKTYKLRFYRLLQTRAEAILQKGGHVIILGDVNTSHRPLDHCDPTDLETFEENPGRQWLNQFLGDPVPSQKGDSETGTPPSGGSGRFYDSFRYFHPTQRNAFTCWCSASGARQTNYGTRIDYILGNSELVEREFLDSIIMPEVEGSDHCPVKAVMKCRPIAANKCPPLCTKYLPEFAGRQQKLLQFLMKKENTSGNATEESSELLGSQSSAEGAEISTVRKRGSDKLNGTSRKKNKMGTNIGQGSLLSFFKPDGQKLTVAPEHNPSDVSICKKEDTMPKEYKTAPSAVKYNQPQAAFWKSLLKGPPPPPNCKGHGEPCVLRTVKKAGPNCGRQFYVCARPEGHSTNPQARCNFFLWLTKKAGGED